VAAARDGLISAANRESGIHRRNVYFAEWRRGGGIARDGLKRRRLSRQ
jgi:hypothetical protein